MYPFLLYLNSFLPYNHYKRLHPHTSNSHAIQNNGHLQFPPIFTYLSMCQGSIFSRTQYTKYLNHDPKLRFSFVLEKKTLKNIYKHTRIFLFFVSIYNKAKWSALCLTHQNTQKNVLFHCYRYLDRTSYSIWDLSQEPYTAEYTQIKI